jgi:hypothetical protein
MHADMAWQSLSLRYVTIKVIWLEKLVGELPFEIRVLD